MTQAGLVPNIPGMDVHARIKERREALGLSMEQLAEKFGVSWQTVQQWEKRTAPKRLRLEGVAEALETTVEYLLYGRGNPSTKVGESQEMRDARVGLWPFKDYITPERWAKLEQGQRSIIEWAAYQELVKLEASAPNTSGKRPSAANK